MGPSGGSMKDFKECLGVSIACVVAITKDPIALQHQEDSVRMPVKVERSHVIRTCGKLPGVIQWV